MLNYYQMGYKIIPYENDFYTDFNDPIVAQLEGGTPVLTGTTPADVFKAEIMRRTSSDNGTPPPIMNGNPDGNLNMIPDVEDVKPLLEEASRKAIFIGQRFLFAIFAILLILLGIASLFWKKVK